ncbi:MAG: excinuclease ABC subunit UvrC [Spirochaetaceae bacterium]|jgi:excinuclease ABC subunit C|nr:excinuclease ABC subunit UvrC [Spirochaetaceae bacterium]
MSTYDTLKQTAHNAPHEPGVYVWRNNENRIIYIGKAKVLRNRLMSYFSGSKDPKTAALVHNAVHIETIITANEYDALLLENILIKQHCPQYNAALKDGSGYPFIKISADAFPLVSKTRRRLDDGASYYGPFPHAGAVGTLLSLIEKSFPLRKCRRFHKRRNPCLYYHIGRCPAPCCAKISAEAYALITESVRRLLSGDHEALASDLKEDMRKLSANLQFEKAALVRDSIKALEMLSTQSSVLDFAPESRDYIAVAGEGVLATFAVFSLREGALVARELYRSQSAADDTESLETFIMMYYSQERPVPAIIYCEGAFPTLQRWFSEHFENKTAVLRPDHKRHRAILAMAQQNAQEDLRKRLKERGAGPALDELAAILHLPERPNRIEGFDVAQLNGTHPVASLVSFKNGVPDKKNYRLFKLRTVVGIVDDYAAIREAVYRRYARLLREEAQLPDLILVDGGIGQVNAASAVLKKLGIDCALVGLAKRDEELWLAHNAGPLKLSRRSEALKVLQFVRDETHRVATSFNQKLRSKDLCFSILESNTGIGPARAAALLKAYPSLHDLLALSPALLSTKASISIEQAQAVLAAVSEAVKQQEQYRHAATGSAAMLAAEALKTKEYPQGSSD